jgi:integrase
LTRDFFRLLILTGQRRDEVRKIAWSEVDMNAKTWTVPADRYKTGVDHTVPLSNAALQILQRRWTENATGFVLLNPTLKAPFNGAASAMRRLRKELPNQAQFTIHDIRRTVRTGLARLNVNAQVAETILGHALHGMSRVYDLHDRMEEQREALNRWADHVMDLVAPRSFNTYPKIAA